MIVDKVWKWTNTVRVGLDPLSSHTQRQPTFPDNVQMGKLDYKTNTGEGGKGKRVRTTSDERVGNL